MKRGKKYIEAAKLIERGNLYEKEDAVALVKKAAVAKFDETIEAHIRTGCDGRHADQQIRGAVVLPHGTGKKVRILVFAKDAKAEEAKAAGADYVGGDELIPKIQNEGWFEFDVVVATPDTVSYTHLAWQSLRAITVPLSRPAMNSVIILSFIGGLRTFELIWAMTGGGPGYATEVMASTVYKQYAAGYYGLSTAGNVIMFILIAVLAFPLQKFLLSKEVD